MRKNFYKGTIFVILSLWLAACGSSKDSGSNTAASSTSSNSQYIQASVALTVSQGGQVVYSDSVANSSLVLTAGQNYNLNLNVQNAPANASYTLTMTNIDQLNSTPVSVSLVSGNNSFTIPTSGDYSIKLQLSASGYNSQTKSYTAQVQCPTPTFTADSLTPNGLSVTSGTGTNLYNFSAAGVIANANGTAPYQCAFDITGVGIADTGFHDCSQVVSNAYVNLVSTRNIGVIVRDSCNTTYSVAASMNLPYTEPSMPGNVFIFGKTSAATGSSATDARVANATYLATNSGGNNIVIPHYASGVFTIAAAQSYGMPSSVNFGMNIQLQGFKDTLNNSGANSSPTIDTSNVTVKKVTYSTDQAGDQNPATAFSGANCTLSNLHAVAKFVAGQPCSAGQTGDQNATTVEVYGTYSCTGLVNSAGNTISISGDFDGMDDIADSCSGGGGGGGGIVPINL